MLVAFEDQILMHFVGHQGQVVLDTEIGQILQFLLGPDAPARIVRRTEQDHFGVLVDLLRQAVQVHFVAALDLPQRAFDQLAVVGPHRVGEHVVDRREDDDPVAGFRIGLNGHAEGVHQPVRVLHPAGLDLPAVPGLQPVGQGGLIFARIPEIAVNAVLGQPHDRLIDRRRRGEVHIRNPHRDCVVCRMRQDISDPVPLHGMGIAAVDYLIEVE